MDIFEEVKSLKLPVEESLDYLCDKYGFLLHGSIYEIKDKIKSKDGKIFATNKAAIAIMRSLYSNAGVNLKYPYFIDKNPLILEIHTRADGKFAKKDTGFVYVLNSDGFRNNPKGSWQFVREAKEIEFLGVVETKKEDFKYPIKIFNDYK